MEIKKLAELRNFLKSQGYNQNQIAEKLGVSRVVVSTLLNGREAFGKKRAMAWAEAFGLNVMWLMTGEGEMLADSGNAVASQPMVYYAPLVSKYAYAGYCRGFGDDGYLDTLPKYPFFVDHQPHGEYYAIEVKGDSMDDGSDRSIKDGSICLCRLIAPELYKENALHLNRWVFVIVTSDGILIKRIKEHDVEGGTLTLESLNPTYSNIEVNMADIKAVLNVVQVTHTPVI